MKLLAIFSSAFIIAMLCVSTSAQTPPASDAPQLEALTKKIDEQNAKIDALSQQILKLEQQVSSVRPGVMIGEATPASTPAVSIAPAAAAAQTGNSHLVAKGETLTSIAKMHKVTVEELQKFNHIENDRKLQIGQTIMIPVPSTSPTSASASPNG